MGPALKRAVTCDPSIKQCAAGSPHATRSPHIAAGSHVTIISQERADFPGVALLKKIWNIPSGPIRRRLKKDTSTLTSISERNLIRFRALIRVAYDGHMTDSSL